MSVNISRILTNGKTVILAYDQGLEHGPADFNLQNIDPNYILDIACKYNAVILQPGVAEKYYDNYRRRVPLIVKLNGKTSLNESEPISRQTCSVQRALKMGAVALGYTVYVGSDFESEMFKEFGKIIEEAHDHGIPVIGWMYPRGHSVKDPNSTATIAHATRAGLELGADFVKIHYNGDLEGFKWIVKAAGRTKVLVAGGQKLPDKEMLQRAAEVMQAGAAGVAVGRGVWQHEKPLLITQALRDVVLQGKSVEEAIKPLVPDTASQI